MLSTSPVPKCSDPHSPRPRVKNQPRPHYRPFMFSDQDLRAIDTIQRLLLEAQSRPKQAVSMAAAVRTAIHQFAMQLERDAKTTAEREEVFAIR